MALSRVFKLRERVPATMDTGLPEPGGTADPNSPLFQAMSPSLQEQVLAHDHLWRYLNKETADFDGMPEFSPRLSKAHKGLRRPNLIYPIGSKVFVHLSLIHI